MASVFCGGAARPGPVDGGSHLRAGSLGGFTGNSPACILTTRPPAGARAPGGIRPLPDSLPVAHGKLAVLDPGVSLPPALGLMANARLFPLLLVLPRPLLRALLLALPLALLLAPLLALPRVLPQTLRFTLGAPFATVARLAARTSRLPSLVLCLRRAHRLGLSSLRGRGGILASQPGPAPPPAAPPLLPVVCPGFTRIRFLAAGFAVTSVDVLRPAECLVDVAVFVRCGEAGR